MRNKLITWNSSFNKTPQCVHVLKENPQSSRNKPEDMKSPVNTDRISHGFVFRVSQWPAGWSHLVAPCVWTTADTGVLSERLLSPDDSVCRASLAEPCPVDHVVSRWAGDTGLVGPQGAAATLWGHTSDHVGDVDGVDLCNVSTVLPLLREQKHSVSGTSLVPLYTVRLFDVYIYIERDLSIVSTICKFKVPDLSIYLFCYFLYPLTLQIQIRNIK